MSSFQASADPCSVQRAFPRADSAHPTLYVICRDVQAVRTFEQHKANVTCLLTVLKPSLLQGGAPSSPPPPALPCMLLLHFHLRGPNLARYTRVQKR